MALMESMVAPRMEYAMASWRSVSGSPALPTMYPMRRNSTELNMDRTTGAKTPLKVPRLRLLSSVLSSSLLTPSPLRLWNSFLSARRREVFSSMPKLDVEVDEDPPPPVPFFPNLLHIPLPPPPPPPPLTSGELSIFSAKCWQE